MNLQVGIFLILDFKKQLLLRFAVRTPYWYQLFHYLKWIYSCLQWQINSVSFVVRCLASRSWGNHKPLGRELLTSLAIYNGFSRGQHLPSDEIWLHKSEGWSGTCIRHHLSSQLLSEGYRVRAHPSVPQPEKGPSQLALTKYVPLKTEDTLRLGGEKDPAGVSTPQAVVEASATHLQKAESQSSRNLQKLAKPAVFISLSWASSKSRNLTVGHSSCHCRSDPPSFWQLSTWDSSKRIFQVAIIACHGFINIVHYLLWHGSHGTPEHAKCITEWKTVSILQINANFFKLCSHDVFGDQLQ